MCWVALDRLFRLDGKGIIDLGWRRAAFEREREAIGQVIETQGFNAELGSYTSELGGKPPRRRRAADGCLGYKEVGDPRMASTYDRIAERLSAATSSTVTRTGMTECRAGKAPLRSAHSGGSIYLARSGQLDEAEHLFERLLGRANDLGLFAEEIDPDTGAALGNFPQAFTHIGLINAAIAIRTRGRRSYSDGRSVSRCARLFDPVGPRCDHRDDHDPAGQSGPRSFPAKPAFSARYFLYR